MAAKLPWIHKLSELIKEPAYQKVHFWFNDRSFVK